MGAGAGAENLGSNEDASSDSQTRFDEKRVEVQDIARETVGTRQETSRGFGDDRRMHTSSCIFPLPY